VCFLNLGFIFHQGSEPKKINHSHEKNPQKDGKKSIYSKHGNVNNSLRTRRLNIAMNKEKQGIQSIGHPNSGSKNLEISFP
jgi:hypothetical protein